ncbi:MAG: helix-turn-helix domain-containing protein [Ignavibacterium sp.]|nr:helix-turn-helix domain-containing protein [Ignavibacterium sp.]
MKKDAIANSLEEIKSLLKRQNDQPLNFVQAAQYLGFSHSYLYKLTSRKIIPCHRPTGKMLFFSKVELDEWVFSNSKVKDQKSKENSSIKDEDEEEDEDDASNHSKFDYE